jgi:hypothetical protein
MRTPLIFELTFRKSEALAIEAQMLCSRSFVGLQFEPHRNIPVEASLQNNDSDHRQHERTASAYPHQQELPAGEIEDHHSSPQASAQVDHERLRLSLG